MYGEWTSGRLGVRRLEHWCALGSELGIEYGDDEAHGKPNS